MARKEPEVGLHVELGDDPPPAMLAALFLDFADAVEHQHRRQRQLGVARAEQLPASTGEKVFVVELIPPLWHRSLSFLPASEGGFPNTDGGPSQARRAWEILPNLRRSAGRFRGLPPPLSALTQVNAAALRQEGVCPYIRFRFHRNWSLGCSGRLRSHLDLKPSPRWQTSPRSCARRACGPRVSALRSPISFSRAAIATSRPRCCMRRPWRAKCACRSRPYTTRCTSLPRWDCCGRSPSRAPRRISTPTPPTTTISSASIPAS